MNSTSDIPGNRAMENPRPGGEMKSRDPSEPTKSQLLPLGSAWHELTTKPYFVPGILASAGIAAMYSTMRSSWKVTVKVGPLPVDVPVYYVVIALLLVIGGAFAIYRMVGKPKAIWLMPAVMAITGLLAMSPVMGMLQGLFGLVGPGDANPTDSVLLNFFRAVFSAGLPEELLKAIPVAVGIYVGMKLMQRLAARHPARELAVLEPLDGILIGAASGFGFAFAETVGGYMAREIVFQPAALQGLLALLKKLGLVMQFEAGTGLKRQIVQSYLVLAKAIGPDRAAFELQRILSSMQGTGLELMIPRLASEVFGHAAYAGIFGYFLGLAAIKPANRVKTVLIGLALAVALHSSWNSMGGSLLMNFLITVAGFVFLAVSIIKARQLSPERSQLVASQVLAGGPMRSTMVAPAAANIARPTVAPPAAAPLMPPAPAPKPTAPAASASITWDDDSNQRFLEIGSARIPASVGARLWERQAPGASASRGDGVVAEVNANPNDPAVLGLKNLSTQTWPVTLADGSARELAPGRSIKLEAGMTLKIGDLSAAVR